MPAGRHKSTELSTSSSRNRAEVSASRNPRSQARKRKRNPPPSQPQSRASLRERSGTQKPAIAQAFASQLAEQGKKAKVFGGDGSNDPSQFKVPGSYVSNFAAPISLFPYNKSIIAGWLKDNNGKVVGSFGPPTYGAVQILFQAIKKTCADGGGVIKQRRDVIRHVKAVKIKNFILGGNFAFSTKTNDPLNARFYIFQIQGDGSYKLVG